MRPHGKAQVDPSSPKQFAVCDKCGDWRNMPDLQYQFEWTGANTLYNTGRLTCEKCMDKPQDQRRTVILPPDPPPVYNTRVEPFSLDEV